MCEHVWKPPMCCRWTRRNICQELTCSHHQAASASRIICVQTCFELFEGVQLHFFLAIAPAKNVSLHHHLHRKVIFVHCLTNLQVGSQTLPCGGTSMPPWVWQGSKTAFFRKKFSPSLQRYLWLCQRHRTTWNPTVLRPWSQSRLNTKSRWKTPNHPEIDLENFGQFQIFQVKPSDVGTWNYISAGETPRCSWFYSILWGSTS